MSYGGSTYGDAEFGSTTATTQEISVSETELTQTTEDPNINPGTATVQATPPTQLTTDNPDLQLSPGTSELTVNETQLTQTTPSLDIEKGLFISPDETQLTETTPNPQVEPGISKVNVIETQLTSTNPAIALNRTVLIGTVTQLNSENPEPEIKPGIVEVATPETQLTQTIENPQISPGETKVQTARPTELTLANPDIQLTVADININVEVTQLTVQDLDTRAFVDLTLRTNSFTASIKKQTNKVLSGDIDR